MNQTDDFIHVSCPHGSEHETIFEQVLADARGQLQKTHTFVKDGRAYFEFHKSEMDILLTQLESNLYDYELEDEVYWEDRINLMNQWIEDIKNYQGGHGIS